MAEGGTDSLLSSFSCGKNRSFLSYIIGKTMVAQALSSSVYLSPVCEREIEWQGDMGSNEPITI